LCCQCLDYMRGLDKHKVKRPAPVKGRAFHAMSEAAGRVGRTPCWAAWLLIE
jgi:hypothetical protein